MSELDLTKVSTPRTAKVLMQKSWKQDMRELAQQLELENARLRSELEAAMAAVRDAERLIEPVYGGWHDQHSAIIALAKREGEKEHE